MTAIELDTSGASARFEIIESNGHPREHDAYPCVVGRDIVVDPGRLGAYCLRTLPSRIDDLVLLAGAVAFADKCVTRKVARSWRRELHLSVPVLEPDFWKQRVVNQALVSTLGLLTGDGWTFNFTRRRAALTAGRQTALPFGDAPALVMPFSDGLDSLAVARLTAADEPDAGLILVTTGRLVDTDKDWRVRHLGGRHHRVSVPFKLAGRGGAIRFREPSYRSRAFVFGVMAGVAVHLLGASRLVISESGQGALGPWLTPVGNEAPDLRMHPVYTRSLAALLSLICDQKVRIDHPRLWFTKGETLARLNSAGLADDWDRTRSCGRDARDVFLAGRRVQCGVCANCLLRRQSLMAASLCEHGDQYLWPRITERSLVAAAANGARPVTANDERHAVCGVLAMAELAALGRPERERLPPDWAEAELATSLDEAPSTVASSLRRLLVAHRTEWDAFVGVQGPHSFVTRWAEQLLC
jgi:hypothetical protein